MTIYQTTKGNDYALDTHTVIGLPASVELHLSTSPELPKRFGKRIKAAGGDYSACRGYCDHRYVTLPLTDDTRGLINDLLRAHGKTGGKGTTVVARGTGVRGAQAWMDVHKAPYVGEHDSPLRHWEERYWKSLRSAVARGMCHLHEGAPPETTPDERKHVSECVWSRADERVNELETALTAAKKHERATFKAMRDAQEAARGE